MPPARRQKWVAKWLKGIHLLLIGEQFSIDSFKLFHDDYSRICRWLEEPVPQAAHYRDKQLCLEFISDRFHSHQQKTGLGLSESEFLPKVITGDQKPNSTWKSAFSYWVVLDNLRSAFNVGSIFRTTDAAGFEGVVISGKTPGKNHLQVSKTAMGSCSWIPEQKTDNIIKWISEAKENGTPIIGIETIETSISHTLFNWPKKGIIILGNEEYGISQELLKTCDHWVHIPMYGHKNSINVANAYAAIAFQVGNHLTGNKSG